MSKKESIILIVGLIIVGLMYRLMPHPANFSPIGAVAIFASIYLAKKWSIILPLAVMLVTDWFIGFYDFRLMLVVYGSMLIYAALGQWAKKQASLATLIIAPMMGSILFFLVTNGAVWYLSNWYPPTWQGLLTCYALAVPFFKNTLLSDLVFTGFLVGSYGLVRHWQKYLQIKLNKTTVS